MAVAVNTGMRTIFDAAYTTKQNISEFIDAIDPREIPLLAMLGWGSNEGTVSAGANSLAFPCFNTTHTWQNDTLIPSTGTLGGAYTSGGGVLTFATGQGDYVKTGDVIMVNAVQYVVASVSTDSVTVTLLDGQSDANAANGDTWYSLGQLRLDGATFGTTYKSTDLTTTSNYTQIFHDVMAVSGTSESVEKYGITNEFEREFAKKFQEMVIKLERAAHYGVQNSLPVANATIQDVRRMGGLYGYLYANAVDGASALLTEKLLVDALQTIWGNGGKPDTILVGATQKRVLNSFASPYVRTTRTEDVLGVMVGTYESDFGTLDIVLDRYVRPSDMIILQREYVGIGPLSGNGNSRAFFSTPIPVDGDSTKMAMTGEYTMEVRNANAHGWIKSLSTTLI